MRGKTAEDLELVSLLDPVAEAAGYDMKKIDDRLENVMSQIKQRPPIVNLAATIALEHYTAIMAHEFLANPKHFKNAEPDTAAMWRWHAMEEIEHKGVAFDTYLHATRDWSRWRRWKLKSLMMMLITQSFIRNRWNDTLDLLAGLALLRSIIPVVYGMLTAGTAFHVPNGGHYIKRKGGIEELHTSALFKHLPANTIVRLVNEQ